MAVWLGTMIAARALGGVTVVTATLGGLGLAATILATELGVVYFGKAGCDVTTTRYRAR